MENIMDYVIDLVGSVFCLTVFCLNIVQFYLAIVDK